MLHVWQAGVSRHQVCQLAAQGSAMGVRIVPQFEAVAGANFVLGGRADVLQSAKVRLSIASTQRNLYTHQLRTRRQLDT